MKTILPGILQKILLTIAGAFLFNFLFWQEEMAINFLIFDLFILGSVLSIYADASWRNSDYSGYRMTVDLKEILEARQENFLNE